MSQAEAAASVQLLRGAWCVSGKTYGLCGWNIFAHGNEVREKAGGEAEPMPGRVLCAAVTEFGVILTVVKTHWRF